MLQPLLINCGLKDRFNYILQVFTKIKSNLIKTSKRAFSAKIAMNHDLDVHVPGYMVKESKLFSQSSAVFVGLSNLYVCGPALLCWNTIPFFP